MASDASMKDIEQVRQFGRNLSIASDSLIGLFSKLNSQMHIVSEGWNDSTSQKFLENFERRCREIQQLSEEMHRFSDHVAKKCDAAEYYTSLG